MSAQALQTTDYPQLSRQIKEWATELGFAACRISRASLPAEAEQGLSDWLAAGYHGSMDYMARHGMMRARPAELVAGTLSVICVRLPYWPGDARPAADQLADGDGAYVSRYALGRDYHKVLRARLQKLADRISAAHGPFGYRAFTDSAPLMEVALAAQSGLGWRGKHTLLLTREAGSYFFLGELLTDLPLPEDPPQDQHCGRCTRCLDACPTGAIVAPFQVDARRCISYLTIEHDGPIPPDLRPLLGNRIYGCDDCQLACPWNRFAEPTTVADFAPRHGLDRARLVELFGWSEDDFRQRMAGSPVLRIGFERWSRNLAVALGNAPASPAVVAALRTRADDPSGLVREHVAWALAQHCRSDSQSA
ncbi:tRNA epoxyqueuosine(34) reductase QueG [Laribacter hongkongensis]|nr:tRNA epoxyqueuosine(34) reductase QueG [Laribacter hongkongensis]MCG9041531.1 tRNA epoxyqueuosine(34) reductase QueG [Laribacter hongkongensis]MCG9055797.1 tRNA epoxyqueuosine(34) reductase QueG [Laribacter hongkongensis]MCG9067819.1 tRNA epoxyqueuosine(34) reductase QueG [Laribacter hongkongensis]MCG9082969.1 tRNA epoxyqueuosine(34) reductase QueG [Laribacter hongkongensis]MCG9088908.1 tRNA epoxyqueuosine(34) reductase QueG [Laribacter hongkongensis]